MIVFISKKEELRVTIGQRIKALRKQRGLSIDELATKLGKNKATVYRYESGDIENLPLDILDPLAKALDTSPAYLMGWTSNNLTKIQGDGDKTESVYFSTNEVRVRHVEKWHKEFGHITFSDEEYEKLIEYARFLISIREKT